jgi:hypothetical protein
MNANHFIIGLGGTGGKIIRAFRQALYREFRRDTPDKMNIGYLYVDSSDEMMKLDDPSWKILGSSVQLNRKSQLLIQDANLGSRIENINEFPGIKPWIGDADQWRDILGGIIGVTLGGQKRRLGRFLFACKAAEFKTRVKSLYQDLTHGGAGDVTFHVCCGLAGGTGSGTIVDVIAQIRDMFQDSRRFKILVYALLPETFPNPNWDTGNYHANGYAALMELNALSVGKYKPVDVTGAKSQRLDPADPFNGCYVFTNENDNGLTVDVDRHLPNIVADFLYQKIIAVGSLSWPQLEKIENAENGDGTPERAPGSNNPERSKRFLTFGIKSLAIPEDEIGEYLTFNFARQAALQLKYSNWSDTSGFLDEPKNTNYGDAVRQKELLEKWLLSDAHLTLSVGVLPEDIANKRWKPINNEWQDVLPHLKALVNEADENTWLSELARLCDKRFEQDYRGLGVRAFYRAKLKAKREHAAEIRRQIENDLFGEWRNGTKSVFDVSRLLESLIDATEERLQAMDVRLVQAKNNEDEAARTVATNNLKFSQVGFVGRVFKKDENLLNAQAEALQQQYTNRTWIEAWGFAKQLTQELLLELSNLQAQVDQVANTLAEAVKRYNVRVEERLNDSAQPDARQQLVRFYNPDLVRSVTRDLVKDENHQHTHAAKVRIALSERLGDNPTFALFNERVGVSDFLDILDTESASSARIAHNTAITDSKQRLLGVSIIERLKERYGANLPELKSYLSDLVSKAGNFASLDRAEIDKERTGAQTAVRQTTVVLPKSTQQADFTATIRSVLTGASATPVDFVESDSKPNQIVLVNLTNLFPLRYVKQVAMLREKYEAKVSGRRPERARIELHGEGDGTQFPSLFIPSQAAVVNEVLPFLLLARVMDLLQAPAGTGMNGSELVFTAKDRDGFDTEPISLGRTLTEALTRIDRSSSELMRSSVGLALERDFASESARLQLSKALVALVEDIKAERGGNVKDDVYRQFLDGGKKAAALLKEYR